jgi:hypothetical protein
MFSISVDSWTSIAMISYLAVRAHWIDQKTMSYSSMLLSCENFPPPHTSDKIAKHIEATLESYSIAEKILSFTSDNAPDIVGAVRLIQKRKQSILHIRCATHVLNIAVQGGIHEDSFKKLIKDTRNVCKLIHRSPKNQHYLEEACTKNSETYRHVIILKHNFNG